MRYYDDETRKEPKGLIKLHEVLLMCPGDKDQYSQPYTIQLMTPDRNWVLANDSQKERVKKYYIHYILYILALRINIIHIQQRMSGLEDWRKQSMEQRD